MDTEHFDDFVVKNRLYLTEKTLGRKAEDYARNDRLSNFKIVAEFLNITPQKVFVHLDYETHRIIEKLCQ